MKGILKFFRDAAGEMEHVAWPTPSETKRYFAATVGLMAAATLVLFLALTIFTNGLFWAKSQVHPAVPTVGNGAQPQLPEISLTGFSMSAESTPAPVSGSSK